MTFTKGAAARFAGLEILFGAVTWGLRPRLYADGCYAGF
jgi:hypothetical protein